MPAANPDLQVPELRVAITTAEFDRLLRFYADGLGIDPSAFWQNNGGRAAMLEFGRASLEIFDETQAQAIDKLEAGQRLSGQIRLALRVSNLKLAMDRLLAHGATLVHPPVLTPWGDYNVRLRDPDGLQVTLFQAPADPQPDT